MLRARLMARNPTAPPDAIRLRVRAALALSAGKPCPTDAQMADGLGITIHAVRLALRELARLRQIRAQKTGERGAYSRRVRVLVNGRWSDWTKWTQRAQKHTTPDHLALVLASGNYQNANSSNDITSEAAEIGGLLACA